MPPVVCSLNFDFQIEMSEMRSIVTGVTSKSLVLIDEICRGTETAKGTCIAGSIVETLDKIGCMGIVSTHLHGIFTLGLKTSNAIYKAMGTESVEGKTKPTWKLIDGICRESLAFETAQKEGIPETIIRRAEELYLSVYAQDGRNGTELEHFCLDTTVYTSGDVYNQFSGITGEIISPNIESTNQMEILRKKVECAVNIVCRKRLKELYKQKSTSELPDINCMAILPRELPPPSTIGASSVYVLFRPDKKLYIGQVLLF